MTDLACNILDTLADFPTPVLATMIWKRMRDRRPRWRRALTSTYPSAHFYLTLAHLVDERLVRMEKQSDMSHLLRGWAYTIRRYSLTQFGRVQVRPLQRL